jgi:hypothetical protein
VEAQILYTVRTIVTVLDQQLEGGLAARWIDWRDSYLPELEDLLRELRRQASEKSEALNAALSAAIDPLLPQHRRSESLSRKALWVAASTPGVTCVLNGMRSVAYVDDSSGVLVWPKLEATEAVYRAARDALAKPEPTA